MSLTMEQQRRIDLAKERLVPAAEDLLNRAEVVRISRRDLGESQLRNLIAIASETQSPAVVINYLKYQMGRDTRGRNWSNYAGGKKVGEHFLDALGEEGAVAKILKALDGVIEGDEQEQLVRIELFRHFLGFASRYMKFLDLERRN